MHGFSGRNDTIVALSSGATPSAIAIIRFSGSGAIAAARRFGVSDGDERIVRLCVIRSPIDGSVLDRALVVHFLGPRSATGEDIVEFHLHGGPALVDRVLNDCVALPGVRMAEPGEFTLRGVLNGRMGLSDAEALADLIDARTEGERRRAVRLAGGALSSRLAAWRSDLIACLAMIEARLDFSDEGDVDDDDGAVDARLAVLRDDIVAVLKGSEGAERLTDGFHIVLAGPPNVGKSSLLNALVADEAAIVSDEPGTTRDVVSVAVDLGGYRVVIHDTAGVREDAEGLEAIGISRTHRKLDEADLIVLVSSPDTVPLDVDGPVLHVHHKSDLSPSSRGDWADCGDGIATALSDPPTIDALRNVLRERVRLSMGGAEAALVTRARQRSGLSEVVAGVDEALGAGPQEIKAECLRSASHAMGRLTGDIGVEDVLDDVFGRFCIGK